MSLRMELGHEYLIQNKEEGIYLTDQTDDLRFFKTVWGGWFWLNSPFDEDMTVEDKDLTDYLDGLVKSAEDGSGSCLPKI